MSKLIGQSLGRYQILEPLGEGGMALVYKAFDTHLEREVAVKIIRKGAFPPEQLGRILKRFEREAKALAHLSHPYILKIYDYGEYEGSPYLVMQYVEGGTLKQSLSRRKDGPVPWEEACDFIITVAEALQCAHDWGIIHRDVKPSNILISRSGKPMLSDFGIVKLLEVKESHTLTGTGVGVGTPEYMAPEQWAGKALPQSDQYSLGVVLYEMLTAKKPYQADTPAGILLKQATESPPPPSKFAPGIPADLEQLLLKTLSPKPEDRFPNMNAFADAIDSLPGFAARRGVIKRSASRRVSLQPVTAEWDEAVTRPMKAMPLWSLWVMIPILVLLLGISGFLGWRLLFAGGGTGSAPESLAQTPASSSLTPVGEAASTASPVPTLSSTATSTPLPGPTVEPILPLVSGMQLPLEKKVITQDNIKDMKQLALWGTGPVGVVRWTADTQYLLSASTLGITQYDAGNLSAVRFIPGLFFNTLFSEDGSMMAVQRDSTTLELRMVLDGTALGSLALPENSGTITTVAFSQDGKFLAIGSTDGQIFIWKIPDGELIKKLQSPQINVTSLAFSPDSNKLASASGYEGGDYPIYLWDINQEHLEGSILKHTKPVTRLVFSPEGSRLVSTSGNGNMYLWLVKNEVRKLAEFYYEGDYSERLFGSVVFSPDGVYFAYSVDNKLFLRQAADGSLEWEEKDTHIGHINSLAFSTDGRTLASGADDCTVRLWGIPDGSLKQTIGSNSGYISAIAFSNDGSKFATASGDKTIHIWRVPDGTDLRTVTLREVATSLVFDPGGNSLLGGLADGSILVIDANFGTFEFLSTSEHHKSVVLLEFSPDGKQLVSGDLNGIVRLWRYPGSVLKTYDVGPADVFSVAPDFSAIAANKYKRLNLWKLSTGEQVYKLMGQSSGVISLAFSPDGLNILSGSVDQTIRLSDAADGGELSTYTGSIIADKIIYSPDGSLSASVGNQSVDFWQSADNTLLRTISLPKADDEQPDFSPAVMFSPDGAYFVIGLPDGSIQLWGVL